MSVSSESEPSVSETTSLTVRLPKKMVAELQAIAEQSGRPLDELADEAFESFLYVHGHRPLTEHHRKLIEESLAEADAGAKRYTNEEVMAWVKSWGTPNELPAPDEIPSPQ